MGPERIELSAKERERLKVLQQVEEGHLKQIEAARRLRLSDRHDAHRALERTQHREEILSIREVRTVADDHTVSRNGQRWGVWREDVCAGLRGARVEIERRLDGSHWLRFRGHYLLLHPCPAAPPISLTPSGLRPTGVSDHKRKPEHKYIPPADHPWRKPWKRTFLLGRKPDIPTLR